MVVKEIRKADAVVDSFQTETLGRICSEETAKQLRSIMEAVVEKGTGKAVKNTNYKVAGKTGTSWKTKNGQYIKDYSTSFAGYFPADNPKYSCIVIIDTPKNGNIYGGTVAAPVFRELADKAYVRDLAIHKPFAALVMPDKNTLPPVKAGQQEELTLICNRIGISSHPVAHIEWIKADSQNRAYTWKPVPLQVGRVPDVSGMTLRDALYLLGNQGLKVRKVGLGRVEKQSLEPGTPIQKGSVITLTLS
jgi:cell division protein FtsI (penicillin-binding protein 3)